MQGRGTPQQAGQGSVGYDAGQPAAAARPPAPAPAPGGSAQAWPSPSLLPTHYGMTVPMQKQVSEGYVDSDPYPALRGVMNSGGGPGFSVGLDTMQADHGTSQTEQFNKRLDRFLDSMQMSAGLAPVQVNALAGHINTGEVNGDSSTNIESSESELRSQKPSQDTDRFGPQPRPSQDTDNSLDKKGQTQSKPPSGQDTGRPAQPLRHSLRHSPHELKRLKQGAPLNIRNCNICYQSSSSTRYCTHADRVRQRQVHS